MDKNSNSYYSENIKHKIEKLDLKRKGYEDELIIKNKSLVQNNAVIKEFIITNDKLLNQYNSLIHLIERDGIIFELNFNEYTPHQWENLVMVKTSRGYEIQTKTGYSLMMLDKKYTKIIEDINKKESQSLIVIRVTDKTSLIQLRFN
ncbi:hypothetical protein [Clostridium lacusfryxellense]|uniref:hypothetical protein n=1 Tax=Clostridium lacusfryxellense TaxID=205328 RepID=UPI001C0AA5C6|nr:hypothetical protein [Clostridium lacusfryxellense]MBU3110849.1 hypothetical protein [Clostridium lacusfryxellense]